MSAIKRWMSAVVKPILRELTVERVSDPSPAFRVVELSGSALRSARVAAGDKVQVLVDGDFRTYTPFAHDSSLGRTSLLVYVHGDAPGSAWGRALAAGDRCHVFGPRGSVHIAPTREPVVLIGDETSIAVARALVDGGVSQLRPIFEVSSVDAARTAASAIGVVDATWIARAAGDAHHASLDANMREALGPTSTLVLTGAAPTIQAMRRSLRSRPHAHARQTNKAYWAPGKRGLD